jgi:hypothetical protein
MSRALTSIACIACAVTSAAGAAQQGLGAPGPQFHAQRLGDQPSPAATLHVMAWLAGAWEGEGLGGVSEEIWSEPRGAMMMGMYRSLKQDQPVFYEFLMFVEEKGTVVLKLKHFNPDFAGWEEKAAFVSFRLAKVEARAVHFDGLSFIREADDSLRIYLLLRDSKTGQVREEEFRMRRVR